MTVLQRLLDLMAEGTLHMALIDPDKQSPEAAGEIARRMREAGSDAILIGGSTGVTNENLSATARAIKEASGLPVVHFPGTPKALSPDVDAVLFMSMLNSSDVKWIVGAQVYAAPIVKRLGLETISMGYVIVEPGMKVGEVGKATPIKKDEIDLAVSYALACQMMGMDMVYFEAGSGASTPVPPAMVSAIRAAIDIPLIVGGGIRTPEAAAAAREAGANVVVTGTLLEQCDDRDLLCAVVNAAKGVGA